MVAMVGGEEDISVLQHVQLLKLGRHSLHGRINGLQGLQTFCLKDIGEPLVDWQHLLGVAQDPLLVRVGGEVVGGGVVGGHVEEQPAVLGSGVLRTMRTRIGENSQEWFSNFVSGPCGNEF